MSGAGKRLIPLLDRVLVEKLQPKKKTAGGVLLPESAISKLNEAKVVAVGPGSRTQDGKTVPPSCREGDHVLLPEFGGSAINVDGKELYLYRDDEILAKLE
ncbi:hypothetical protein GpartN1_g5866.t1 [Galdieria partita]|uniref:Chaperonin 10 n=1 Tax=Galdieria partita TaxID=83374 RepID=A0A9C7Q0X7_9RHOD|nr:hypothetical protein GpartN1_g5866.t1 [Galdieria partita]